MKQKENGIEIYNEKDFHSIDSEIYLQISTFASALKILDDNKCVTFTNHLTIF
jgi:hypothetical protein